MKFDIILKGSEEFYPKLNNKIYNILKIDNIEKENYMTNIINSFIKNQNDNINEKHYIGLDYEFNKVSKTSRDVALMQMNLENNSDQAYIFVLYPPTLSQREKNNDILIKLLTNRNMIKILHGSESLDIPYLFDQLLIDKDHINNFCYNLYDTKFLCDYYHLTNNSDGKCSIYNLLIDNKIITNDKVKDLELIEEKMGPIYLIHIDIHKLNNNVLKYSLYDVLFLIELIKKFINIDIVYSKIIPDVTVAIHKYKRNVESIFLELEENMNRMNLYFIKENNNRILLQDIWSMYYFYSSDKKFYLDKIKEIHYFKKFFDILTKFITYSILINCKELIIYKKNNEKYINNIDFNKYYGWLNNYKYLFNIIDEFRNEIQIDIVKIMKRL